jgi:hypothetical protein
MPSIVSSAVTLSNSMLGLKKIFVAQKDMDTYHYSNHDMLLTEGLSVLHTHITLYSRLDADAQKRRIFSNFAFYERICNRIFEQIF